MQRKFFVDLIKYVVIFSILPFLASAQVFNDNTRQTSATSQNAADWAKFYNQKAPSQTGGTLDKTSEVKNTVAQPPAKQEVTNPEEYIYKKVPQIDRPTLDGTPRGRTSVEPVVKDGKVISEGYIYLFYSDFNVGSMMNGATTCDVKFQILTTLDRKLNALAIRLKWPKMNTPLTFIDINPNQKYHMTYTLLGDGCYSMDKIPNIVINRCRIKGMTQEECASRVRWIRKL